MTSCDALTADIDALRRQRDRLAVDIRGQQRLLEEIRWRVTVARRDRATEAAQDFDVQVDRLDPWLAHSRRGLIARLRAELPAMIERGEEIDLVALVKQAPPER